MSRNFAATHRAVCFALTIAVMLILASANAIADEGGSSTTAESRSSLSLQFRDGGRSANRDRSKSVETIDQFAALETAGVRKPTVSAPVSASGSSKNSTVQTASLASNDFWIYDADVVLFSDDDSDGYFYGIDLLLDADTIYGVADVYAVVYLSYEGGPWNEYAATEDFTIFGTSPTDDFVLVTELSSGYPTGNYDLLIELFDAFDGEFLASYGPSDTSELAFLPLEDFNRDAPGFDRPVTVTRGGGGATGLWLLISMAAIMRRRKDAASPLS
jgi:hypothetical protein